MSKRARHLLPRPNETPAVVASTPSTRALPRSRRSVVPTACKSCRQRRSKCDGNQPCAACVTKNTTCDYDVPPGTSRAAAQKERVERIEMDNTSMLEIFWYLQTRSIGESQALLSFARTQAPGDFGSMTAWLRSKLSSGEEAGATAISASGSSLSSVDDASQVPNHANPFQTSDLGMGRQPKDEYSNPSVLATAQENVSGDGGTWSRQATVTIMADAVEAFLEFAGLLFHIYEKEVVDNMLTGIRHNVQSPDTTQFLDVYRSNPQFRVVYAGLAGMASVGLLYRRVRAGHTPTHVRVRELAQHFYDLTRWTLDFAIESDPLQAMKLCVPLALYNISLKATVALVYIDLGVALGRKHGMSSRQAPDNADQLIWEDYERVFRTLILLSAWLGATLGFIPEEVEPALLLPAVDTIVRHEQVVQREIVRISILKARMIRSIEVGVPVSEDIVTALRGDIRLIGESFPDWMSTTALTNHSSPAQLRPMIIFAHLFHLSALQLLCRRVMRDDSFRDIGVDNSRDSVRMAVVEGLAAARRAAPLLRLMVSEGLLIQVCWLCIFSSWTTGVVLLQAAVQKILCNYPAGTWTSDFELVRICLHTLDTCAEVDEIAGQFRDLLRLCVHTLEVNVREPLNMPDLSGMMQDTGEYMFVLVSGDSDLHKLSRDLFRLMRQPFEQRLELADTGQYIVPTLRHTMVNSLEAAVGASVEWVQDLEAYRQGLQQHERQTEENEMLGMEIISAISPSTFVEEEGWGAWSIWTPRQH